VSPAQKKKAHAPRIGRPPLPEGKARGAVFTLRLSDDERATIEAAALRNGKPVTQWARDALLTAART